MRRFVYVTGKSMEPTLVEGQYLLCNTSRKAIKNIKIGDIIVAKRPDRSDRRIIKRVTRIFEDAYFVIGDNKAHSTDSRDFGAISKKDVFGVIDMVNDKPLVFGNEKEYKTTMSFKSIYKTMRYLIQSHNL